jgi:hypothetical protein
MLLLKYPTRGRPDLFKATMQRYIDTAGTPLMIVVSIDEDDATMTAPHMAQWMSERGIACHTGPRRTKIAAINADIPVTGWSALVLGSDDHIAVRKGWGEIVLRDTEKHPDSLLWYKDIRQDRICLMPVMDRAYYSRTSYIYHPAYVSLWCDNEQTEVAQSLGRLQKMGLELWRNESPDWGGVVRKDQLYKANNSHFVKDQITYNRRKKLGFPHE